MNSTRQAGVLGREEAYIYLLGAIIFFNIFLWNSDVICIVSRFNKECKKTKDGVREFQIIVLVIARKWHGCFLNFIF